MQNFKGVFTALITPFNENNVLDEKGLRLLINRQLEEGVDGLAFLGTTAEDPTLTPEEKLRILQIAKEECFGKTTLIVGTGTYSTESTIKYTLQAQKAGADAALIITPYYNKPTQEGIYKHFKAISEATNLPIILYNNPTRTGVGIHVDTLRRLMEIPSIVGIKECTDSFMQISNIIEIAKVTRPDFTILSGDDTAILSLMALGGHGVISVASNLIPSEIVTLVRTINNGEIEAAQSMHYKLMPLMRALFSETNPIGIKAALELLGLPAGACRLPLCDMSADNAVKLEKIISIHETVN